MQKITNDLLVLAQNLAMKTAVAAGDQVRYRRGMAFASFAAACITHAQQDARRAPLCAKSTRR